MDATLGSLARDIYPVLPAHLTERIAAVPEAILGSLQEIRLRVGQPLLLALGDSDLFVGAPGRYGVDPADAYCCRREDVALTMQAVSRHSLYALERELKLGFITIRGGHRVGLAGQAIADAGGLKALKNIGSLNIRLARQVRGCADLVLPYLLTAERRVLRTLVISPPRCGKTTLLRDLAAQLSRGRPEQGFDGVQVGVVDERSEIAACRDGVPTVDLGWRADVLDGCPKAEGMLMLIRSMAPQVIVTDELGRQEDALAVGEAVNAGVAVVASAHGGGVDEVRRRPYIGPLIEQRVFARYVELDNRPRVGSLRRIADGGGRILYERRTI